jgi:hypothetical protein
VSGSLGNTLNKKRVRALARGSDFQFNLNRTRCSEALGLGNASLERISFNLIQIEGNPRPAQAGNIAVALKRVNPIGRNTLYTR